MPIADVIKYRGGALAGKLYESNSPHVGGALEELAVSGFGWSRDDAEGFVKGTMESDAGIKKAIGIYSGKYNDAFDGVSDTDLLTEYDPVLSDPDYVDPADLPTLAHILNGAGANFKTISDDVRDAQYILKGRDTNVFTPAQIAAAETTVATHGKLVNLVGVLEDVQMERLLRPGAARVTHRDLLKGLAS